MSITTVKVKYRHSDDCLQSGCPSHKAYLEYNSITGHYFFDIGENMFMLESNEVDAFLRLLEGLDDKMINEE